MSTLHVGCLSIMKLHVPDEGMLSLVFKLFNTCSLL